MQIKLLFENDKFIIINLLNDSLIEKWCRFYSNTKYKLRHKVIPARPLNPEDINYHWQEIINTLDTLSRYNFKFPIFLTNEFDKQQSTLNYLHRFFTYNLLWYREQHRSNPYDSSFIMPNNLTEIDWYKLLDRINSSVHFLENHTNPTLAKTQILSLFKREMKSLHVCPLGQSWFDFENEGKKFNENFLNCKNLVPVMLDDSILGKSFLQSYIDDDDPRCKDCTGRLGSHGGFYIDFNNDRKTLYNSSQFISWLKKYNINPETVPYEFLIGYVTDRSDISTDDFYNYNLFDIKWIF